MPTKPLNLKHISRIDRARTRGWSIRVSINGQYADCFVSDSKFGSKVRSRNAAIKIRDTFIRKFPTPARHKADVSVVEKTLQETKHQLISKIRK